MEIGLDFYKKRRNNEAVISKWLVKQYVVIDLVNGVLNILESGWIMRDVYERSNCSSYLKSSVAIY